MVREKNKASVEVVILKKIAKNRNTAMKGEWRKRYQRKESKEINVVKSRYLKLKMRRDSRNIRGCREIMSWKITKSG